MRQYLLLAALIFLPCAAIAATSHGEAAAHWSSQAACEMATQAKCTQDNAKAWHVTGAAKNKHAVTTVGNAAAKAAEKVEAIAPVVAPQESASAHNAAVPPQPAPAPPAETAKPNEGFFTKLFGDKKVQAPMPAKPVPDNLPPPSKPLSMPKPPELERQPVDPEIVLRGKVWTSEAACKKEALKGKCSSIDCATHSGGACSGYTSMIWIYR